MLKPLWRFRGPLPPPVICGTKPKPQPTAIPPAIDFVVQLLSKTPMGPSQWLLSLKGHINDPTHPPSQTYTLDVQGHVSPPPTITNHVEFTPIVTVNLDLSSYLCKALIGSDVIAQTQTM